MTDHKRFSNEVKWNVKGVAQAAFFIIISFFIDFIFYFFLYFYLSLSAYCYKRPQLCLLCKTAI